MPTLAEDMKAIRHRTRTIKNTFENTGTIEREDLDFLCDQAIRRVALEHIAEHDWASLQALKVTSTLEINELDRQLKDALAGE